MAVKLHRCSLMWFKLGVHPCWKVQKALDEQGIDYEVVKGPASRGKRDELERLSGQRKYPTIEFEDGSTYRAESGEMAEKIRLGTLFEAQGTPGPAGATGGPADASGGAAPPAQPV
jgi:glutaredoxin